jgi:sacsin
VSPAALSSSYVLAGSDQEAAVMVRHLAVHAPTAAQVYRTDILPQLTALPRSVRDTAMLLMLRHLPDLQQQDSGFGQLLAQTAFLPSGKEELHVPSELYDPRTPELVALLDPDACFPAPAFCGDVADATQDEQQQQRGSSGSFSTLAVLQQLGLRSSAQLDTLVAAARYVERVAAEGDDDMAVARGKVCVGPICLFVCLLSVSGWGDSCRLAFCPMCRSFCGLQ